MSFSAIFLYVICWCTGERNLSCLTQNGVVRFTKKLDFNPSCFFAYHISAPDDQSSYGKIKTMVSSHSNQLLLLQDTALIWAAAMSYAPVQMTTAHFQSVLYSYSCSPI